MELAQFHSEVVKRLLSIKSCETLQCEVSDYIERPVGFLDSDSASMSVMSSWIKNHEIPYHESGEQNTANFDSANGNFDPASVCPQHHESFEPEFMMEEMKKMLERSKELEMKIERIGLNIQKLEARNVELEDELKEKEITRLSQLKMLSLRNAELEKQVDDAGLRPKESRSLPAAAAWASWDGTPMRKARLRVVWSRAPSRRGEKPGSVSETSQPARAAGRACG